MRINESRVCALLLPLVLTGLVTTGAAGQNATQAPVSQGPRERVVTGDHAISPGEVVEEIVVVGGDLRVGGEVRGDAVVLGGDLILEESGVVNGDAVVTGGELLNEGGRVRGEMRTLAGEGLDIAREIQRAVAGAETAAATAERSRAVATAREAARARSEERRAGNESNWVCRPHRCTYNRA